MKSKNLFWIIGGGLLFGAVTYFVTKLLLDEKTEGEQFSSEMNETSNKDFAPSNSDVNKKTDELDAFKVETSNVIVERHQAAAEIIKESVKNIMNEETEAVINEEHEEMLKTLKTFED